VHVGQRSPLFAGQFVGGYHHALYVACGIALAGAFVAVATVRKVRHPEPIEAAATA